MNSSYKFNVKVSIHENCIGDVMVIVHLTSIIFRKKSSLHPDLYTSENIINIET